MSRPDRHLSWSREAVDSLRDAREWIAQRDPVAARRVAARLQTAASGLIDFPHRGRLGSQPGLRELVVTGTPFILLYEVDETQVRVIGLWHHARLKRP